MEWLSAQNQGWCFQLKFAIITHASLVLALVLFFVFMVMRVSKTAMSSTTPMKEYMTLHARLERCRAAARSRPSTFNGPKVVVCGGIDCGKSTICQMLLNWAVRAGCTGDCSRRLPIYVDTDVGQNGITVPGSLAARTVDNVTPVGVEDTERQQRELPQNAPLSLWFGSTSPSDDCVLFLQQLQLLASYCAQKMKMDPLCLLSCIILLLLFILILSSVLFDEQVIVLVVLSIHVDGLMVLDSQFLWKQFAFLRLTLLQLSITSH